MIAIGEGLDRRTEGDAFDELLDDTIRELNTQNEESPFIANGNFWSQFEVLSHNAMMTVQRRFPYKQYNEWEIRLLSGAVFPDIVAKITETQSFGVEVKTTQGHNWRTLGGSIMEGTRIPNIERINVLFARLNPFVVRTKRFDECIADVAITHSPRYIIDFDIQPNETIFDKIGINYNVIASSDEPFEFFRAYFQDRARRENKYLWFIASRREEAEMQEYPSYELKFFSDLQEVEKRELEAQMMVLHPHIFTSRADYKASVTWLLKKGILYPNIRDSFSGGENCTLHGVRVSSKFRRLKENMQSIITYVNTIPIPKDIYDVYNSDKSDDIFQEWKRKVTDAASYDPQVSECAARIIEEGVDPIEDEER
jgi:hypothetical protein